MLKFLSFENLYFKSDSLSQRNLTLIKVFLGGFTIFHNLFFSVNNAGVMLILLIYYSYLSVNYAYILFLEKKLTNMRFHLNLFLFFLFLALQYRVIGSIDILFITMYVTQGWIVYKSFFFEILDHRCPKQPEVIVSSNSQLINNFFKVQLIKNFVIIFLKYYNGIILLVFYIASLLIFCFPIGIHLLVIVSGFFLFVERLFVFFNSKSSTFSRIYFDSRVCCTNREHLVNPILRFLLAWEGINYAKDGGFLLAHHVAPTPEKAEQIKDMFVTYKQAQSTTPVRYAFEAASNCIKTSSFTSYDNFKKKD